MECENFDIIFLQETFYTEKFETIFKCGWKGHVVVAPTNSSPSRGVAILFKCGFEGEIVSKFTSDDGRVVIVKTNFRNNFLSFISVNAPNNESERVLFLEKLQQMIFKHVINPDNIIMAGDFKCCLNLSDRFPVSARSDKSVKSFAKLMQNCKLIDSWLQSNPGNPGYTYFDKKSNSYSRLNYILLSQDIKFKTKNIKITQPIKNPGVVDHSAVKLVFEARNF